MVLPLSLFTSERERRLWGWTLAVVAAIYSTLGLARTLAAELGEWNLGVGLFLLCCVLVVATAVTLGVRGETPRSTESAEAPDWQGATREHIGLIRPRSNAVQAGCIGARMQRGFCRGLLGLRVRPGRVEVAVALGVVAAYLLVFVRMSIPTERSHLIEYGVVALFIHEALRERASRGRRVPATALMAVLATALIGVIDECIQLFLPSRVYDPLDMLFNVLAAGMAVAASSSLGWARKRTNRSRRQLTHMRYADASCELPSDWRTASCRKQNGRQPGAE